jgi:bleomycin hydrolase
MAGVLSEERLEAMRERFYSSDKNRLAQNVCSRSDPLEACLNRR